MTSNGMQTCLQLLQTLVKTRSDISFFFLFVFEGPYLDLVQVDFFVLLFHSLVGCLHGIHGCHDILQVFGREGRLFHVEGLLLKLLPLALIKLSLLQDPHCLCLDRVLENNQGRRQVNKNIFFCLFSVVVSVCGSRVLVVAISSRPILLPWQARLAFSSFGPCI